MHVGATRPINGSLFHSLREQSGVAYATKVEAFHLFAHGGDCPCAFEHTKPSTRHLGLRETAERSRFLLAFHQCRVDPGFQARRRGRTVSLSNLGVLGQSFEQRFFRHLAIHDSTSIETHLGRARAVSQWPSRSYRSELPSPLQNTCPNSATTKRLGISPVTRPGPARSFSAPVRCQERRQSLDYGSGNWPFVRSLRGARVRAAGHGS